MMTPEPSSNQSPTHCDRLTQHCPWDRFTPFLAFTPPVRKLL
jgi:hypothetical protein